MGDLDQFSGGGQFLSKADVPAPIVATIASTSVHTFPGETRAKLVLHWSAPPELKSMACNPTNVQVLRALFSVSDSAQLVGKTVEIFVDQSIRNPAGQIVGGLRLRAPTQQPAVPAQPPTLMQQPVPPAAPSPSQPVQPQQPEPAKAPW